jgi:hypothetical protein
MSETYEDEVLTHDSPGDGGDITITTAKGVLLAEVLAEELFADECLPIARRLVACWNACRGIDTEALEAGAKAATREPIS